MNSLPSIRLTFLVVTLSLVCLSCATHSRKTANIAHNDTMPPLSDITNAPPGNLTGIVPMEGGNYFGSPYCQRQRGAAWCWAACIASITAQGNYPRSQEQVAADLNGWAFDVPASLNQVVYLLNMYGYRSWPVARPANPWELHQTLQSGYKLIAYVNPMNNPSMGHFIVVQGIRPDGSIVVCDPVFGQDQPLDPQTLYLGYKWQASAVVGR